MEEGGPEHLGLELLDNLLRGFVVGLSIAAPVGPIGLLCIQRSLTNGRLSGLASGLGAATADATYGSIAGFGLTYVSAFLVGQQLWIRLAGGAFLVVLGARIFLSVPKESAGSVPRRRLMHDYLSTFALTFSNPLTIIAFAAVFAGLGLVGTGGDYSAATPLVLGVFAGSTAWWVILSSGVSAFRTALDPHRMRWINRISGVVIVCFGAIAFLSLLL